MGIRDRSNAVQTKIPPTRDDRKTTRGIKRTDSTLLSDNTRKSGTTPTPIRPQNTAERAIYDKHLYNITIGTTFSHPPITHDQNDASLHWKPNANHNPPSPPSTFPVTQVPQNLTFATDFSGMEAPAFALRFLGIQATHKSAADTNPRSREFIQTNFPHTPIAQSFGDVITDAIKNLTFYFAGPPCQPWSPAGAKKGKHDPRADLYDKTIDRIIATQPLIAFVENSSAVATAEKGRTLRDIKHKLTQGGYQVVHATINTLSHGLPQYLNRLWIIAFRSNHDFHNEWKWPDLLPTPELADVLLPIANDQLKPERRPNSQVACKQSDNAQVRATQENTKGDWAIDERLSERFLKHPRPRPEAPALTLSLIHISEPPD